VQTAPRSNTIPTQPSPRRGGLLARLIGLRLLERAYLRLVEISQSNSFPGFMIPSGSNAARTLRINAISAALRVLDK
jgi:hypothetical protein